jgi:MOSC domain-containing protein YiiM
MDTLQALLDRLPQKGQVTWIGVRPARGQSMSVVKSVLADQGNGLSGDRFQARDNAREVTLIQAEHIDAVASMMGVEQISPEILRRNIVVSGLNLLALKGKRFKVGDAILEYTGLAHPCSKMEEALGPGGYNAMRGHGGITSSIVSSGQINLADKVLFSPT